MKRRLYTYQLMIATLMVVLSTMVFHHHHAEVVCTAVEICQLDGNANDSHTEHHENEENGCTVQQMHQFTVKSLTGNDIAKQIHHILLLAILPEETIVMVPQFPFFDGIIPVVAEKQPFDDASSRRGPPATC